MQSDKAVFKTGYHKLLQSLERRWLENGKTDTLDALIKKGMESYRFTTDIDEQQLLDIRWQLNVDLREFIKSTRQQPGFANSPHYLALESTLWQWALAISDKCQIEWLELSEDIKHDGLYQATDVVGLGQFLCTTCSHSVAVYYPQTLTKCNNCQGMQYRRIAFSP